MKRFLKPTGRILTTAVFTSTAFETIVPTTAVSVPIPEPLPPDTISQMSPDEPLPPQAQTIIPPEALYSQEFTQDDDPQTIQLQVDGRSPHSSDLELQISINQLGDSLADTSPSVPPINFVLQDIPDLDSAAARSSRQFTRQPIQPQTQAQQANPIAERNENAPSVDHSSSHDRDAAVGDRPASQDGEAIPIQVIHPPSEQAEQHPSSSHDVIAATREWLDETLARLVNRDRMERETQLRTNLIASANEYIAQGDVTQARFVAENPALTDGDRNDLMAAIAEAESNAVTSNTPYPFVSAEQAIALTNRSIRSQPLPSRQWLLSQMDQAVATLNPTCYSDNQATLSASASTPGSDYADTLNTRSSLTVFGSGQGGSGTDRFLSGSEFLAGVGHQPPSITTRHSAPPPVRPNSQPQIAARQGGCTPTLGQNIGGLTFATLSGYQWLSEFARPGDNALRMVLPLAIPAAITSHFGWRTHPIYGNRRFHFGVDFGAPSGTPILAALPGRVETSNYLDGYGLTVILESQDPEQRTLYAHMSGIAVQPGAWVEQGEVIGWVGSTGNSTGPHLHFEVHQRQGNEWVAVDPLQAAAQLIATRNTVGIR